jgi:hypothetical protein
MPTENSAEALQGKVMELFQALCGDPDNTQLAADADAALQTLDTALDAQALPVT